MVDLETKSKIEAVVWEVFLNSSILQIEKIPKGFMNTKYLIRISNPDKDLVLKIADGKRYQKPYVLKEAAVLKLVKNKLPDLPVPEIFLAKEAHPMFSADLVLMSKLPGIDLADLWGNLSREEKADIVYQMGCLLAKLHTIKSDKFGGIANDGSLKDGSDSWAKATIPNLFEELGKQEVLGVHAPEFRDEIIRYFRSNLPIFAAQQEPTLVHIDWHKDHFRVEKINGKWKVVGVLDFEFAEYAPKLYDFVKSERWLFRDEPATREPFMRGYKEAGGRLPKNHSEALNVFRAHHKVFFVRRLFEGRGRDATFDEYTKRLKELIR